MASYRIVRRGEYYVPQRKFSLGNYTEWSDFGFLFTKKFKDLMSVKDFLDKEMYSDRVQSNLKECITEEVVRTYE